jgi:sulfur carrier protein ThiS
LTIENEIITIRSGRENMGAKIKLRDKVYEVEAGMTILDAIRKCDIKPESVLITRDEKLVTDDEILKEGDEIRLVRVISGG